MSDSEFRTGYGTGGILLVVGYLAPSIKRFVVSKSGVEFETHDRSSQRAGRDAAEELTAEVEGGGAQIDPDETLEGARLYAGNQAMRAILDPDRFSGAEIHVYLMDARAGGLVPAYGVLPRLVGQAPWAPGVGAVGKAYKQSEFVLAVGDSAHDETHGLDESQQSQHHDLVAVAATPILNLRGTVIGVLSASERDGDPDECYLGTDDARAELMAAADGCARVLVDLLHVFSDDV